MILHLLKGQRSPAESSGAKGFFNQKRGRLELLPPDSYQSRDNGFPGIKKKKVTDYCEPIETMVTSMDGYPKFSSTLSGFFFITSPIRT